MKFKEIVSNRKIIISLCLIIFIVLIILPPIIYGYVYPNASDDSAHHLQFIDKLKKISSFNISYFGEYVVGYPIIWINNITGVSIDALFLWFNYISLVLVGLTVFFVVYKLVGWLSGLFSLLFLVFCIPTVLTIFGNGEIYDLITLGIFVPLFIYGMAKLICNKKWVWAVLVAFLFTLCVVFHSIGIFSILGNSDVNESPPSVWYFIMSMVGATALVFIVLIAFGLWTYRKNIKISSEIRIVLIALGVLSVFLAIFAFTHITNVSGRFAVELPFVLGMIIMILFGVLNKNPQAKKLIYLSFLIMILGSIQLMFSYLSPSSAITQADKQAIAYVNSLSGEYYSCSPEVAPWVYERFINKTYKEGELPYISRNIPMTWGTNSNCVFYWWKDKPLPTISAPSVAEFEDRDVVIKVED